MLATSAVQTTILTNPKILAIVSTTKSRKRNTQLRFETFPAHVGVSVVNSAVGTTISAVGSDSNGCELDTMLEYRRKQT